MVFFANELLLAVYFIFILDYRIEVRQKANFSELFIQVQKKKSDSISCLVPSDLCDPVACSPAGSSVHGILQARTLEWTAMPSSRETPQLRD